MVWADRIGIGSVALVLIAGIVAAGLDKTAEARKAQSDKYAASVALCSKWESIPEPEHKNTTEPDVDYLYWYYGRPSCPPKMDEPINDPLIFEAVVRIIALVVLPLWLVLSVLDFMFGGPDRRRAIKLLSRAGSSHGREPL
jgi:hypothetical protein